MLDVCLGADGGNHSCPEKPEEPCGCCEGLCNGCCHVTPVPDVMATQTHCDLVLPGRLRTSIGFLTSITQNLNLNRIARQGGPIS